MKVRRSGVAREAVVGARSTTRGASCRAASARPIQITEGSGWTADDASPFEEGRLRGKVRMTRHAFRVCRSATAPAAQVAWQAAAICVEEAEVGTDLRANAVGEHGSDGAVT